MNDKLRKLTGKALFLPIFCMILVLCINVVYDIAQGNRFYDFFVISIQNGVLYGRLITVLNRGSEVAILAIGMTLVVSASAGTDISVGSVMSLCASLCCMLIAGFGVTSVASSADFACPMLLGILAGILMGGVCGAFNGTLVAYLNIQPMVATLILYTAARSIGLLLCNDMIVYIRTDAYGLLGSGSIGVVPTPIIVALVCVVVASLILKKTAMGMYIQSVGINKKASRIAGLNSKRIIFMCYVICGLFAGIAGIIASSRITSADSNNIGLNYEMDAILAVALGGNSLAGGKFNLVGSIIGAYTIQAITTTMYAMGVSTSQAPVFKAIVIIIIVAIQSPVVKAWFSKRTSHKEKEAVKA
ncbi:MAG: ABC transporter permease [Lachnospiraceae bacterium]|nr:ABC transporter permease [Lachnospiraceae bacterium]